jgi:hypothetical protein
MITRGPVDVLVMAAADPHFDGSIFAELARQAAAGTIRVLDAMILLKGDDGSGGRLGIEDLGREQAAALGFIDTGTRGLFDNTDAETLYEGMVPGSVVIALAIEHTWAVALVNALHDAGVDMAMNFRVPAPIVDEAFASLATRA